jgi:hypothetical protein
MQKTLYKVTEGKKIVGGEKFIYFLLGAFP